MPACDQCRSGHAYTSNLLHGKGLTRTTAGDGQDGGSGWAVVGSNELAVRVQVRGGTCALTTRLVLDVAT
jgi:hypothetical protein